ncbi:MAG: biopolymer transport protein ExbD [Myxococcota bacterium]|jgi:biopolymer transport protein ExbD
MRKKTTAAELNLMPVMNLVTILIPLLLMGAQMMNLAVVDTTLPAICNDCDKPDTDDEPLNLSLFVSNEGMTLKGVDRVLDDPRIPCTDGACRSLESYDFATLTRRLTTIKDAHPNKEHLILVPDDRVPYEVIIGVMDAARETGDARLLFPSVTLSGGAL